MPKHQIFIRHFTHEFMQELWSLRHDQEVLLKITRQLLSVLPNPDLPLPLLLSKNALKIYLQQGKKDLKLVGQGSGKKIEVKSPFHGLLTPQDPIDLIAIQVLVELLGQRLAQRYEHVLSEYLAEPLEKSHLPLAYIMAKRLAACLQLPPAVSSEPLPQISRLLNLLVKPIDTKEPRKFTNLFPAPFKHLEQLELPLQEAHVQNMDQFDKFMSEAVINRSAWYDEKQIYEHEKTQWHKPKDKPKQPKYGYSYLADPQQRPMEMKMVREAILPPLMSRYYYSVSLKDIQDYLESKPVQQARAKKQTTGYSFHLFLHDNGSPLEIQAVCHARDLRFIKDWSYANFRGVDFSCAVIDGNLSGTDFSDSYLLGIIANTVYCNQHPLLLARAQLGFSSWSSAKLTKVDLTEADLTLANFSSPEISEIEGQGAHLYKTALNELASSFFLEKQIKQIETARDHFQGRMHKCTNRPKPLEKSINKLIGQLTNLQTELHKIVPGTEKYLSSQKEINDKQIELRDKVIQQSQHAADETDLDTLLTRLRQLESRFAAQQLSSTDDSPVEVARNNLLAQIFTAIKVASYESHYGKYLSRYELLEALFSQCVEHAVQGLSLADKLRIDSRSSEPINAALIKRVDEDLVYELKRLGRYLALTMYAKNQMTVSFVPAAESSSYQVWHLVLVRIREAAAFSYQKYKDLGRELPDKAEFINKIEDRANQLIKLLPLKAGPEGYCFEHGFFYHYLLADSIVYLTENRAGFERSMLAFFRQRPIQSESIVLEMMAELAPSNRRRQGHPVFSALRYKLLELVQRSAIETGLGLASSNAASIINACKIPLSEQEWSGVQLAGADLSYGVFAHSNLVGANLRGANMAHADCYHTKLMAADLRDVIWGEYPRLNFLLSVNTIALHPKRPWSAVVQGNKIILCHRQTGKQVGETLSKHISFVKSISFSPDGNYLASGSKDGMIWLWQLSDPKGNKCLRWHQNGITSLTFSHDNAYLASASRDGQIRLWNVARGKPMGIALRQHTGAVSCVAFSPDGRHLVSASADKTMLIWQVSNQSSSEALVGHKATVSSLAFSADGSCLASGDNNGRIYLWDMTSREVIGKPLQEHGNKVTSIVFSPNGRQFASASADSTVRLWRKINKRVRDEILYQHQLGAIQVIFSTDGLTLISASHDTTIRFYRLMEQQRRNKSLSHSVTSQEKSMPRLFEGAELSGCQMSETSQRLLQQYGANVSEVILTDDVESPLVEKAEQKQRFFPSTATFFSRIKTDCAVVSVPDTSWTPDIGQ